MYSSRRSYRKYPKKYRKYRYNIKDIYSPSLYKAPTPNYYQQKGRVLQQSPRLLINSPTVMLSPQKLNDMYQTLVNYKYKFPDQPLPPGFEIQPFLINANTAMSQLFPLNVSGRNYKFGPDALKTFSLNLLTSQFPALVNLYEWQFQLFNIQFNHQSSTSSGDENLLYSIAWNTNLLVAQTMNIFDKSQNNAIVADFYPAPIGNRPDGISSQTGNVRIRCEEIYILPSGAAGFSTQYYDSNDSQIAHTGQYPYIDTEDTAGLYGGELEFVPQSGFSEGQISNFLQARLYILCTPISLT